MAGDPEASGVGDPLAVAEDHVGPGLQPVEGFEERRGLAEREQARDIREPRRGGQADPLDHLERPGRDDHHGGVEDVAPAVERDVGRRQGLPGPERRGRVDRPASSAWRARASAGVRSQG